MANTITAPSGFSVDSTGDRLYYTRPDGKLAVTYFSALAGKDNNFANKEAGQKIAQEQYGIDIASLPKANPADMEQLAKTVNGISSSNGVPIFHDFNPQDFASLKANAGAAISRDYNTDPSIQNYVNPNVNYNPTPAPSSFGATASTPAIDYTLRPGESISAYNTRIAAGNPNLPAPGTTSSTGVKNTAPIVSTIGNPIGAPSTSSTIPPPNLPKYNAPSQVDTFNTGLMSQLENQRAMVQQEADKRAADYKTQLADLEKKQTDLQILQDEGMANNLRVTMDEVNQKKEALALEKQRVDENYNANQALINEMDGLLTQGNQIIQQMKDTTGLSSIMNPRISKTMSDVQARAGVIQAILSARNGQIGVAQNQLASTVDTINSIAGDQIAYYNTLVDYYENLKDENGSKIITLSKEQKGYLDVRLSLLTDQLENTQKAADTILDAMLDPDTALAYAEAGVSLTDSPAQISKKLAIWSRAEEIKSGGGTTGTGGGTGGGTPPPEPSAYKFTSTQLNSGSAAAGMLLADFKTLDPEVQNFYINSKPLVAVFNEALSAVKSGTTPVSQVRSNIQAMNIPESVRQYLIKQLPIDWNATNLNKPSALEKIWDDVKGYLGF